MAIYEKNSKIYYVSRALRSTIELYCTDTAQISGRHSGSPLGYFIQISITTPVVSALKNCYMSTHGAVRTQRDWNEAQCASVIRAQQDTF